ncbi:hypothetical protein PAHAL_5G323500 [Panicum hallii]|uniref:Uncharacterized protein n=1 Tax=Panicum hallii TaxID=206008 RepID=A0A2T8ILX1_9POAL|nr:hypothetical protein PAHAL_5G323500 [Panicum hallii]
MRACSHCCYSTRAPKPLRSSTARDPLLCRHRAHLLPRHICSTLTRAAHEFASHPHAASLQGTRASAPGSSRAHFLRASAPSLARAHAFAPVHLHASRARSALLLSCTPEPSPFHSPPCAISGHLLLPSSHTCLLAPASACTPLLPGQPPPEPEPLARLRPAPLGLWPPSASHARGPLARRRAEPPRRAWCLLRARPRLPPPAARSSGSRRRPHGLLPPDAGEEKKEREREDTDRDCAAGGQKKEGNTREG